jgi:4'-phosphopantetheinyl transferase
MTVALLSSADVHVYYGFTDDISPDGHAGALRALSAEEQEREARFVFLRDRLIFVSAHTLLRQALSLYEDVAPDRWAFERNAYGKPRLSDAHTGIQLQFNLAHTQGLVACVVCRHDEVGIDVESVTSRVPSLDLAERFFSPNEVADLRVCPEAERDARFIEFWTLKESYIKALGVGLSHPLETFGFAHSGSPSLKFQPPAGIDPKTWQFGLYAPSPDYRLAVGVRRHRPEPCHITVWQAKSGKLRHIRSPCILGRFNL